MLEAPFDYMQHVITAFDGGNVNEFVEHSASRPAVTSVKDIYRRWESASNGADADCKLALSELQAAITLLESAAYLERDCGEQLFDLFTDPYSTCTLAIGCSLAAVFGRKCMDVELYIPKLIRVLPNKSIVSQAALVALAETLRRYPEGLDIPARVAIVKGASQSIERTCNLLRWGQLAVRVRGMDSYLLAACRLLGQFGEAKHELILDKLTQNVQKVRVDEWDGDAFLQEAEAAMRCIRIRHKHELPQEAIETELCGYVRRSSRLLQDADAEIHTAMGHRNVPPPVQGFALSSGMEGAKDEHEQLQQKSSGILRDTSRKSSHRLLHADARANTEADNPQIISRAEGFALSSDMEGPKHEQEGLQQKSCDTYNLDRDARQRRKSDGAYWSRIRDGRVAVKVSFGFDLQV